MEHLISAPAATDFFIDPANGISLSNAPFFGESISGDFSLTAELQPAFASTYDAASLFIKKDETHWIKLAFELTDLGFPALVSVVTNGASDDCNHRAWGKPSVRLGIFRRGAQWALHVDSGSWEMLRYFHLDLGESVQAGHSAQSPLGRGTTALIRNLRLSKGAPASLRSPQGSTPGQLES